MLSRIYCHLFIYFNLKESGLEKIESSDDEYGEVPDKDFGFEGVNLRTNDVDFSDDENA